MELCSICGWKLRPISYDRIISFKGELAHTSCVRRPSPPRFWGDPEEKPIRKRRIKPIGRR